MAAPSPFGSATADDTPDHTVIYTHQIPLMIKFKWTVIIEISGFHVNNSSSIDMVTFVQEPSDHMYRTKESETFSNSLSPPELSGTKNLDLNYENCKGSWRPRLQ